MLLQLPDPPALEKGGDLRKASAGFAAELYWSGVLKGDWDPEKHPRTGEPPNAGWFAEVPGEPRPPAPGWPTKHANKTLRQMVKEALKEAPLAASGPIGAAAAFLIRLYDALSPDELNTGEDRVTAQINSVLGPPKTFEELQEPPTNNRSGYELHHIVEQNPANVEKNSLEKFGRARLEESRNKVWVPRLKHEFITGYFNETDEDDPRQRRRRVVIGEKGFDEQYEIGLARLRFVEVLK